MFLSSKTDGCLWCFGLMAWTGLSCELKRIFQMIFLIGRETTLGADSRREKPLAYTVPDLSERWRKTSGWIRKKTRATIRDTSSLTAWQGGKSSSKEVHELHSEKTKAFYSGAQPELVSSTTLGLLFQNPFSSLASVAWASNMWVNRTT